MGDLTIWELQKHSPPIKAGSGKRSMGYVIKRGSVIIAATPTEEEAIHILHALRAPNPELIAEVKDLLLQATTEHSHHYTASTLRKVLAALTGEDDG